MDKQAFNYAFDLGIREAAIRLEKRALEDHTKAFLGNVFSGGPVGDALMAPEGKRIKTVVGGMGGQMVGGVAGIFAGGGAGALAGKAGDLIARAATKGKYKGKLGTAIGAGTGGVGGSVYGGYKGHEKGFKWGAK